MAGRQKKGATEGEHKASRGPFLSEVFPCSDTAPGLSRHPKARLQADRYLLGHGRNGGLRAHRRIPAGTRTASLQAHNAAPHEGRFCALLSPAHGASPGQAARSRGTLARPGPARRTAGLRSSRPPILCALRGAGRIRPSAPGWPHGTALSPAPNASRSTLPWEGADRDTHR